MHDLRVFLLGGTSHVGKSTLADALASHPGWSRISTDALARHPGRPWTTNQRPVPEHVDAHYRTLSTDELTEQQLHHYEQLWPRVEALIENHATDTTTERLVLEGSGVLPERVAALNLPHVAALWLTSGAATLRERIYAASRHDELSPTEQLLVENFLARSVRYQQRMLKAIDRIGLTSIDTSSDPSVKELLHRCRDLASTS
jgi:2-phosphoglycerate kinase